MQKLVSIIKKTNCVIIMAEINRCHKIVLLILCFIIFAIGLWITTEAFNAVLEPLTTRILIVIYGLVFITLAIITFVGVFHENLFCSYVSFTASIIVFIVVLVWFLKSVIFFSKFLNNEFSMTLTFDFLLLCRQTTLCFNCHQWLGINHCCFHCVLDLFLHQSFEEYEISLVQCNLPVLKRGCIELVTNKIHKHKRDMIVD